MKTHLGAEAVKIRSEQATVTVTDFFQATIDSLFAHIAILRADGTIIAVNAAWNTFATGNGLLVSACGPGANYFEMCETACGPCSEESRIVASGIRDVSRGRVSHFQLEYACHSTAQQRWFTVRVTRFKIGSEVRIVVAHDNITKRKLAEIRLGEANRLLEAQAMTDGLTGVGNRRRFDQALANEWKRHRRSGRPLSVLLLDVDYFKKYNDICGHLAGDDCLKEVARTIRLAVRRPGDVVARTVGRSLPSSCPRRIAQALAMASMVGEALRLRRLPHPALEAGRCVTMSIGCSTMVPVRGVPGSEIVHRADRALYQAKAEGRDRFNHSG